MDGEHFAVDKSLLNPKFEGYKLRIIPQEEVVFQYPLANRPTQTTTSGRVPLTFQEVRSRITHNHLAVDGSLGRALYIDADYRVILIELGQDALRPVMRQVYDLPKPIQSDAADIGVQREYPSAAFFSPTSFLVSDGQGTMYILGLEKEAQPCEATLIGKFVLPPIESTRIGVPLRIHHARQTSPLSIVAILSSRYYPSETQPKVKGRHTPIFFDVWSVKICFEDVQAVDEPVQVEVLWHRRGEDVPLYTAYDESHGLYLLVGDSEYQRLDTPPLPTYEPSPDEIAPIPRPGESFATDVSGPPRPPPYSWIQTPDSVTIAIPIPSDTPKDKIRVLFSSTTLTVHINHTGNSGVHIPRYSAKKLWDGISTSSSFWTFDREAERTFGVLSLHLEKQHEGTRWSQVFASASTDSKAEEDLDVPETLDPSELWNIREALEKYTAALRGEDVTGLGLGKGVPSLAENEIDEEVDASVGRMAYLTWVADPSSSQIQPEFLLTKQYATPFQLLSTPLPGSPMDSISLVVKNNIDGTVFTLDKSSLEGSKPPKWNHTATYPALAFTLASKRDTRFTHHIPGGAVLAFEGGSSNRGGNIYIYYRSPSKALTAQQSILKINDGRGGSLMGVGSLIDSTGKIVILCLTEGELTLIKDI